MSGGPRPTKSAAKPKGPGAKKRPTEVVPFCLDDDVAREHEEAKLAFEQASAFADRMKDHGDPLVQGRAVEALAEAEERLAKATTRLDEETWVLRVEGLAPLAYRDLKALHPPTEEQKVTYWAEISKLPGWDDFTQAQQRAFGLDYNFDTFPRALVGACSRPPLSEEELEGLFGDDAPWSETDKQAMLQAAERACTKTALLRR